MSCISVALPPPLLEALGVRRRIVAPERALRIGVEDSHIVSLVHRLHARASGGQPLVPLHADGLSLALASYVYSHFAGESESTPAPGPRLTLAQRELLVALIEARIAEPIRLVELAAAVGYSQDHFLRLFGASFGLSPHRYVTSRRVEHAKAMLKDPERSLVAVAFACGFSSQAHFNTVFKQRVGITPGRYRSAELAERVRVAGGGPHARGAWPDQEREHAGAAPPFGPGALPLGGHARQPGRHDVREP